jgi:hypothetical protein
MSDRPNGTGRQRRPHAQIHLPPLSADYALTLVDIFERATEAVWRAHGEEMTHLRDLRALHARAHAAGFIIGDRSPETPQDEDL